MDAELSCGAENTEGREVVCVCVWVCVAVGGGGWVEGGWGGCICAGSGKGFASVTVATCKFPVWWSFCPETKAAEFDQQAGGRLS